MLPTLKLVAAALVATIFFNEFFIFHLVTLSCGWPKRHSKDHQKDVR